MLVYVGMMLFLVLSVFAICPPDCSEGDVISPTEWDAYTGEKTSDMFMRLTEKTSTRFLELSSAYQREFMSDALVLTQYPDIANTFYSDPDNVGYNSYVDDKYFSNPSNLVRNNDVSSRYLNIVYGTDGISYEVIEGMHYNDNSLCYRDITCLISEELKSGVTSVRYNLEENSFCFDPFFCISANGEIDMDGDQLILPTDSTVEGEQGRLVTLEDGTILHIDSNNNVIKVQGKSEGEINNILGSSLSYVNNEGVLEIDGNSYIIGENALVSLRDMEVQGSFMVLIDDGFVRSVQVDEGGSYADSYGSLRTLPNGIGRVHLDADGNWLGVDADNARMQYSVDAFSGHQLQGSFGAHFSGGKLARATLRGENSFYYDSVQELYTRSTATESTIVFTDELPRDIDVPADTLYLHHAGVFVSRGKWYIETPHSFAEGLMDTTVLRLTDIENGEQIDVSSSEKGHVARIGKKVLVGDLALESRFVDESLFLSYNVYNDDDGYFTLMDLKSNQLLADLLKNPRLFSLIEKNLFITTPSEDFYFGIERDLTQRYGHDDDVTIVNPTLVHRYLGNDVETLKGISRTIADLAPIALQSEVLSRAFTLSLDEVDSFYTAGSISSKNMDTFSDMKDFIATLPVASLQHDALLASFITTNIDHFFLPELFSSGSLDEINRKNYYPLFVDRNFRELQQLFDNHDFIGSDDPFRVLEVFSEANQFGGIDKFIIYNSLLDSYLKYNLYEDNTQEAVDTLTSLFVLSSAVPHESDNQLESREIIWDVESALLNQGSLIRGIELAYMHAENGDLASGLGIIEMMIGFENQDTNLPLSIKEDLTALRDDFANIGFNKIDMDLFIADQVVRDVILNPRMGAVEQFRESDDVNILQLAFQGGYIRSLANSFRSLDEFYTAVGDLESQHLDLSMGNAVIKELYNLGVPPDRIHYILSGEGDTHQALMFHLQSNDFYIDESVSLNDLQTEFIAPYTYFEETYNFGRLMESYDDLSLTPEQEHMVRFFLGGLQFARSAYEQYSDDYNRIIGVDSNELDINLRAQKLAIDLGVTEDRLREELSDYDLEWYQRVAGFVDDGLSPGTVFIAGGTGALFGNILHGARGLAGGIIGIGEFAVFDALVGSGIEMAGGDVYDPATYFAGTGGALASVIGGKIAVNRLLRESPDVLAESLARSAGARTMREIDDVSAKITAVIRSLNPEEATNPNYLVNRLNAEGVRITASEIDEVINSHALAAFKRLNNAQLRNYGLTKHGDDLVTLDGAVIRSPEDLSEHYYTYKRLQKSLSEQPPQQSGSLIYDYHFEKFDQISERYNALQIRSVDDVESALLRLGNGNRQKGLDEAKRMFTILGWETPGSVTFGSNLPKELAVVLDRIPAPVVSPPAMITYQGGIKSVDIDTVKDIPSLKGYVEQNVEVLLHNWKGPGYDAQYVNSLIDGALAGRISAHELPLELGIRNKYLELIGETNYFSTQRSFSGSNNIGLEPHVVEVGTPINPSRRNHILGLAREDIVIDFQSDPVLRLAYENTILPRAKEIFHDSVQRGDDPTLPVLNFVYETVHRNTPYSKSLSELWHKDGGELLLGECLYRGGVCRHQGPIVSSFAAKLADDGLLNGYATFNTGPGHAWGEFIVRDGNRRIILDPAQYNFGYVSEVDAKGGFSGSIRGNGVDLFYYHADPIKFGKDAHMIFEVTGIPPQPQDVLTRFSNSVEINSGVLLASGGAFVGVTSAAALGLGIYLVTYEDGSQEYIRVSDEDGLLQLEQEYTLPDE